MRFHLLRLLAYLLGVLLALCWGLWVDSRTWFALLMAVAAGVVGSPAALLSLDGIRRGLGWLEPLPQDSWIDEHVLDEERAA